MKWVVVIMIVVLAAAGGLGWMEARKLQNENAQLRAEMTELRTQMDAAKSAQADQTAGEIVKLRADAQDVLRLRNEVNQLRASTNEINKLRAQVSQLQAQNAQARGQANTAAPAPPPTPTGATNDSFPRQNWNFAGYATPESALVSAIWAMREGKPQVYLDSLSPEEQQRMAQTWQNKSEQEIASKHQSDVATITGMRILNRQELSPDQVQMQVFIEGANRNETVTMKKDATGQWKFGGFMRNQQQQ